MPFKLLKKHPLSSRIFSQVSSKIHKFADLDCSLNIHKYIRLWICVLLVGACVNTCLPLKAIQRSLVLLATNGPNDEPDEDEHENSQDPRDERDSDDERSEDDDLEPIEIEKDYLVAVNNARYLSCMGNAWCAIDESGLHGPVIDILVPPPKAVC